MLLKAHQTTTNQGTQNIKQTTLVELDPLGRTPPTSHLLHAIVWDSSGFVCLPHQ
jgi:hypothetical protein